MNWRLWDKPTLAPVFNGECAHLWSNWSEPGECRVKAFSSWSAGSREYDSWAQDRHCLNCNRYERRVA